MIAVLLVDDEPAILDITKMFLEQKGEMTVTPLKSAPEAIEKIKHQLFDVIVSDFEMPEMTGVQFLRELRQHGNRTPFIIFTGKGREAVVIDALNAGATFYLEKSVNPVRLFSELAGQIEKAYQRHTAEAALAQSSEKYRVLIEYALEGIVILDTAGNILFANRAAAKTFDLPSPEMLIAKRISQFVSPEITGDIEPGLLNQHPDTHKYSVVQKGVTAQGRQIWIDSIGKRITYEGAPADLVSFRDITSLRRTSDILRILNKKLHLVSSIIRHDIRNKITAIYGYTELAKNSAKGSDAEVLIREQIPLLEDIITELDFVRDYEKLGVNEPVMMSIADAVNPNLPELQKHGITIANEAVQVKLFSDPLLERVFFNLFDNSIRHGGRVTVIRISARKETGGLILTYEDNGRGVPADSKERIFDKGVGTNTGLGLFLIREILAITGITIRETGEPGRGARFEMQVPEGAYAFSDPPG